MQKGNGTMIILETQILFENYNKLFDFISEMDSEAQNGKTFESHVEFEGSSWSFVSYSPDKVASFRELAFEIEDPNFQEACEDRLGLLEICEGGFKYPQYIAITPNVDMDELRKKWCLDYCEFHNLTIRETTEEETDSSEIAGQGFAKRRILPC